MALDKETIKKEAQKVWGVHLGVGDNVVSPVAISINYADQDLTQQTYKFAQAIYALGVADEREKNALMAEEEWSRMKQTKAAHYRNSPEPFKPQAFGFDMFRIRQMRELAEAIRKGE